MWDTVVMVTLATLCALIIILNAFGHVYRRRSLRAFTNANMLGKTVIITGATAGEF